MDPSRLDGPGPGPSLPRAPVRHDRRVIRVVLSAAGRPYTRSLSNRTPVLSWRSSAWLNAVGNGLLARMIELTDLCAAANRSRERPRSQRPSALRNHAAAASAIPALLAPQARGEPFQVAVPD